MEEIIEKLNFIKIENFCFVKDNAKRLRRQDTYLEKIFVKYISGKVLLSKICKEFLKLNIMGTSNMIRKWTKDLNRHLSKKIYTWYMSKHLKRFST